MTIDLLRENGITCSMSRAGEVWDNSAMESFFSSMKTERISRKTYRTREQARADVFDYIERVLQPDGAAAGNQPKQPARVHLGEAINGGIWRGNPLR